MFIPHFVGVKKKEVESLEHYGIKGMKWGVRKDRVYTSGGRIKKGEQIFRITSTPNEKHSGRAFASVSNTRTSLTDEEIKESYTDFVAWKTGSAYEMNMEVTKDLILPSMVEKGRTFVDEFLKKDENVKLVAEGLLNHNQRNMGTYSKQQADVLRKYVVDEFKAAKSEYEREGLQILDEGKLTSMSSIRNDQIHSAYLTFTAALDDEKVSAVYFQALTKKGYSAVTDDFDVDMWKKMGYEKTMKEQEQELKEAKKDTGFFDRMLGISKKAKEYKEKKRIYESDFEDQEGRLTEFTGPSIIVFDRAKSLKVISTKNGAGGD